MSVEEAIELQRRLEEPFAVLRAYWLGDASPTQIINARQRLILEVQAAMPCMYRLWNQTCPQRYYEEDEAKFCVACTARAELARRKVPA